MIGQNGHLPRFRKVAEQSRRPCLVSGAVDHRQTVVEFTLREALGGEVLDGTENLRFASAMDAAVRQEIIFHPATDPQLLTLASQEQKTFLVPPTSQNGTLQSAFEKLDAGAAKRVPLAAFLIERLVPWPPAPTFGSNEPTANTFS